MGRDSGLVMPGRPPRRDATVLVAWAAFVLAVAALFLALRPGSRAAAGGSGEPDEADDMEDLAAPAALENRVTDLELRIEKAEKAAAAAAARAAAAEAGLEALRGAGMPDVVPPPDGPK